MSLENIIITYGYPAILVGTFLEGETVLVLGALAAHLGYLELPGVMGAAFSGSLIGDQLAFQIGRRYGTRLLEKKPRLKIRVARVNKLTARFRTAIVLGFRFLYGLRNVIPFTLGMSTIKSAKFLFLNIGGAVLWVAAVGTGGFLFGHAMDAILGNARLYEVELFAGLAIFGIAFWVFNHLRSRRKDRSFHRA